MSEPNKTESATRWRTVHKRMNKDWLFAEDLGPPGSKFDVEIVKSSVGDIVGSDGGGKMPYLQFRGKKGLSKKFGLNPGNCKRMETLAGTDVIERWTGWITLVVVRTTYTDRKTKERFETDAIRIAPKRPTGKSSGETVPAETAPEAPADEKAVVES